jgi:hypothetical protein
LQALPVSYHANEETLRVHSGRDLALSQH